MQTLPLIMIPLTSTRTESDGPQLEPGSLYIDKTGNHYRWVQNKDVVAITGGICYHKHTSVVGTIPKEVYRLGTADTALTTIAGVFMSAIPANGYGWIQTKGYGSVAGLAGTTTALAIGMTGGAVSGQYHMQHTTGTTASGTAPIISRHIVLLEGLLTTVVATTQLRAYINAF
jgi:hypothetical protein